VLREPVVHFLALGALLFAANAVFAPKREASKPAVVVSTTIRVP
jgi:hypothetical protein